MSEWKTARLCEVADVRVSNVDKKSLPHEQTVLLCNYMDVYSNDYITSGLPFMAATAAPNQIERFRVQLGDVMITKDSETPEDIGIPSVAIESIPNLVCGYHLALLKPDSKQIDGTYLAKQLGTNATANYFACRAAGSTRYGLSNGTINETPIPLAPLPQQRRIATILTTLDEVIEATEKLVEKHQQIKAGLMHDLFTRGLWTQAELARGDHQGLPCEATAREGQLRPTSEEAPGLYQDSPLGLIPKDWKVKNCSQICEKITVGIVIRPTQYYVPESGVPAFRSANIKETGIDMNDLVFISDFSNSLLAKSQVKAGDVLSVRTGYPGTSAVVPEELEGCNCIDILISRPTSEIASQFLCDWINSSFGRGQVLRKQGGLAQQHFNVGDLRNLQVVIPSDTEQAEIGLRLAAATENIATENTHLAKLRQQKQGLMHDLLTGRVRVSD